ncbi:hypothetical protein QQP08_023131 [Theobroma cacao]|nr:hypothetical protein QQP08_023131 [Theobroma cacao]
MGLHQNLEEEPKGAKQGPATLYPGKKTLVKKKMFDQMVQCITSCRGGRGPCCCSGASQSSESGNCAASEVAVPSKTAK